MKKEVTDSTLGPVRAKAGAPLHVEDFYPLADGCNDGCLGSLKRCLELRAPGEFTTEAEKRLEGSH